MAFPMRICSGIWEVPIYLLCTFGLIPSPLWALVSSSVQSTQPVVFKVCPGDSSEVGFLPPPHFFSSTEQLPLSLS